MSAEKRLRVVLDEPLALVTVHDPIAATSPMGWHYEEEWVPRESTEEWTEWRHVSTVEDRDPTYFAGDLRAFRLGGIAMRHTPHRVSTVTSERKLIRRWVDREKGPMAEVVDTETRRSRW